jgi:catalase
MINSKKEAVYCKFHSKTDQKIKNLDVDRAKELAASDPDYSIRDLYNAIAAGNYPSWTFYIQIMTFKQAEKFRFNPFDVTKVWPHKDYPLMPVGRFVLNRNPVNYFAEIEQIAFNVAAMVPGIEPSPDKMLQGRLFSYADTHRHRLGTNYLQIPVNASYRSTTRNYQRDGAMAIKDNQNGAPNYYPNSFCGPEEERRASKLQPPYKVSEDVVYRYDSGSTEDNFSQAADFWNNVLDDKARNRLVANIADHLRNASEFIQERAVKNFAKVNCSFGKELSIALKGMGK